MVSLILISSTTSKPEESFLLLITHILTYSKLLLYTEFIFLSYQPNTHHVYLHMVQRPGLQLPGYGHLGQ